MVDDKPNARDRNRVPGDQDHEVAQFALHHGISLDQTRSLIDKFGSNRQVLEREAWKLVHH